MPLDPPGSAGQPSGSVHPPGTDPGSVVVAAAILGQIDDALVVTGPTDSITLFNPAAERQYGIPMQRAIGRTFDQIVEPMTLDGSALGRVALDVVQGTGSWQGRVLHRPRIGSRMGETLVVDVRLTALRDDRGDVVGIIGTNRDVTGAARLEAELAALGALAAATGRARSRHEIAEAALERLCVTTGADAALLVSFERGGQVVEASRNISRKVLHRIRGTPRCSSPLEAHLRPASVLSFQGAPQSAAEASVLAYLGTTGIDSTMLAPLGVRGDSTGFVMLCWRDRAAARPSEPILLQVAGHLAVALDGARLTERLGRSLEQERRLTASLETMVGLTELPEEPSEETLARFVLERLMGALGSVGGFVCVPEDRGLRIVAEAGASQAFTALLRTLPIEEIVFWRELSRGLPAYVRPLRPGYVHPLAADVARAAGHATIAALPIRHDGRLVGVVVTHFSGAGEQVVPGERTLEAIARVLSIAFANMRLGQRLSNALAAERRLSSELQTLQELTRLGAASDDLADLARETTRRLMAAVRATGGTYVLLDRAVDRFSVIWSSGAQPNLDAWLCAERASVRATFHRFDEGANAYARRYDDPVTHPEARRLGRLEGLTAYAALPLRVDGEYVGQIYLVWAHQPDPADVAPRFLESTARVASISLANFRLRERLRASEERYRTLFAESPDALQLEDFAGTLLDLNEAAAAMYGAGPDQLVGRPAAERAAIDEVELAARLGRLSDEGRATFRGVGVRQDGSRFPEEVTMRAVEIGGERRILSLVRDLTEQERLQAELLQAQKMESLGQLVSGVAHELNNPLAAVIAFSQLLRDDARLPADMRHDADLLAQEADRTRRIVQNLLDFARRRAPERRLTSIRSLVQSVLELQAYALRTARVGTAVEIPDEVPPVAVDRAQLQQVLLNLTTNAIQAIHAAQPSGTIRIRAAVHRPEPGPATVRIAVVDDGPGVPPDVRGRLFDPFFTTKEPGEGTGLGLSVSFGIVTSHGGRLWHEPGPGGRGCTFVVELPLEEQEAPTDVPGHGARPAGSPPGVTGPSAGDGVAVGTARPAVLVLDDEPSIRAFLGRVLRSAGMDYVEAESATTALERVRERAFDALLIDHRMAGMDGTEFYEAAVALRPELATRAVFMSGDVLNPDLRGFAAERHVLLLAKPFDVGEVGTIVREVLVRE